MTLTGMGDSSTERSRRFRAHRRGDHSLCRSGACRAPAVRTAEAAIGDEDGAGDVRDARDVVAALDRYAPALVECASCGVLIAACRSLVGHDHPLPPPVVGQLRACLAQMSVCEHDDTMPLDKFKAKRQAGRLISLIDRLG